MNLFTNKEGIIAVWAVIGSILGGLFGGWTIGMQALIVFMVADYVTGVWLALFFKKSKKTKHGGLSSKVGLRGLFKKGGMLVIVLVAFWVDKLLGVNYVREAVIYGFCFNEAISITENVAQMDKLKIPKAWMKALEVLREKTDEKEEGEANGE